MAISFPNPDVQDEITHNGVTYKWDSIKGSWEIVTPTISDFVQQSYVDTLHEAHSKRIQHNSDLIEGLGKVTASSTWTLTATPGADTEYTSRVSGDLDGGKTPLNAKLDNRDNWVNVALTEINGTGQVGVASYDGSFDDVVAIAIHSEDLGGTDQDLGGNEILMVGGEVEIYQTSGAEFNTNLESYTIATIDSVTNTGDVYGIVLRPIHGVGTLKPDLIDTTVTCVFHSGVAVATTGDLSGYLPTTGGTINGDLTISGNFEASQLNTQITESAFVLRGSVVNDNDIPSSGLPHQGEGTKTNEIVLAVENPSSGSYSTYVGYYGARTQPYSLVIQKDLASYYKTDGSNGAPLNFNIGDSNHNPQAGVNVLEIRTNTSPLGSSRMINVLKGSHTMFEVLPNGQVRNGAKTLGDNNRNLINVEYWNSNKFKPGNKAMATTANDASDGGFYFTEGVLYFKTP